MVCEMFHSTRTILKKLTEVEGRIMGKIDDLIAQMVSDEAAMEQRIDAAVTALESEIATLQNNGLTPTSLQNLQNIQAALASFKGKPTVTVTPATATVATGTTQQFSANVDVTWSAGTGTIDATGLYTAPAAAGTDTVTATAADGSGATGTAAVTVTSPPASGPTPAAASKKSGSTS